MWRFLRGYGQYTEVIYAALINSWGRRPRARLGYAGAARRKVR